MSILTKSNLPLRRRNRVKNTCGRRGVPSKHILPPIDETRLRQLFSVRMRGLRQNAGLTQYDLADFLGVSQGRINAYERARAMPRAVDIHSLCRALKTDPNALLGFT